MRRAGQLVSERRLAEAEVEIVEALTEIPDDPRAHKLLALVRFRLGRLVAARESYRRVVDAAPDDAPSRLNLGLIALKLERFEEAADELAAAVRLRPDDTRALAYLGHAQARLGRASEAARTFRQAGQPGLAAEIESHATRELGSPFDARNDQEAPLAEGPQTGQALTGFVHARLLDPDTAAGAAPGGVYRLPLAAEAYVQAASLLAAVGEVAVEPARRRQRGQLTAAPLAGPAATFLACRGEGELWLTPAQPAGSLDALDLEEDVLFVREASVLAFSGDLVWESGAIPRSDVRLLHLSGSGRVLVDWAGRDVVALRLLQGRPLTVSAARLCGWIGHLAINLAPGAMVACEGEGVLLIARNGQAGERIYQRAEPGHDGAGHPDPGRAALHR
jgi:tetratricopeptide (TPR) repeat protein